VRRSWLLAQLALVALLAVPLYLAVMPSVLRSYVGWGRVESITAFFAIVPLALLAVVVYHWYQHRRLLGTETFAFDETEG
jgi:uncharacterized membrane protein YoaT (DUF817 family)